MGHKKRLTEAITILIKGTSGQWSLYSWFTCHLQEQLHSYMNNYLWLPFLYTVQIHICISSPVITVMRGSLPVAPPYTQDHCCSSHVCGSLAWMHQATFFSYDQVNTHLLW